MNARTKLLTLALCSSALFACACSKSAGTGGSGGVAISTGGANAGGATGTGGGTGGGGVISASDKPLDAMLRAAHAQLDARSYRANIESAGANDAHTTLLVEYAAPDRYHMVTHAQVSGREFSQEYVIVGKDTFMRMNGGAWSRFPVDMKQLIAGFRDPKFIDDLAKQSDVKLAGPDTLDGQPMLVYSYSTKNPMGMNIKSDSKTWVAVSDGLPRKTESEGEMSGKKTKSTITFSDYNSDIRIEPPIK